MKEGGVYLFPGRTNSLFKDADTSKLDEMIMRIDSEPGTLRTIIDRRGARVYIKNSH